MVHEVRRVGQYELKCFRLKLGENVSAVAVIEGNPVVLNIRT
jgi:hypothetical protein